MIARRTAVKNDLMADEGYVQKVDAIGDPLQKIEAVVDFSALAFRCGQLERKHGSCHFYHRALL
jgi:hypothetical protein